MPKIEWKLDLGNLITISVLLVAAALAFARTEARIDVQDERINQAIEQRKELKDKMTELTGRLDKTSEMMIDLRVQLAKHRTN